MCIKPVVAYHFYDNEHCFIIELQDGRIRRVREYMDTQHGFRCIFSRAMDTLPNQ